MTIDRRLFVSMMSTACITAGVAVGSSFASIPPAAAQNGAKPLTRDAWMAQWMRASKAPDGMLHLSRFRDPMYFLTKPISWSPNPDQVGRFSAVEVPAGFVTDFASIPRIFYSLLRPDGEYTYPAIIHDYLYWTQTTTREAADEVFKLGMEDFSMDATTIAAVYRAVRAFGQTAWNSNAKAKDNGEKRILKEVPNDPRVRWRDWKIKPGVFM